MDCPACLGHGSTEYCPRHVGHCPCAARIITCDCCDGRGRLCENCGEPIDGGSVCDACVAAEKEQGEAA